MEPCVVCDNVTKTYHSSGVDTPALRGATLSIRRGELLMLVGPSGCGKTTLISIIAGILLPDSGTVHVLENHYQEMTDRARTAFRGSSIGFVFQSFNLIPTLTAQENVAIPLLLNKVPRKDALEKAALTLSKVGLGERTFSRPTELSGGQQQRVAVARALVHEPKLIVCDEPTSALDRVTGMKVMELFREVALADGRTLLIVSHDNRIFRFADRIARMNDGLVEEVVHSEEELTG